ncbi:hypothetical protein M405DRAFT_829891 [Rhizopogon salebrosus TDB-379]|nr:hypothetical protein M405DRAFT_829891 [Rhizopogon salebrosus TDB-379]
MFSHTPCRSLKYRPVSRHSIKLDISSTSIPFNTSTHSPQPEDTNFEDISRLPGDLNFGHGLVGINFTS